MDVKGQLGLGKLDQAGKVFFRRGTDGVWAGTIGFKEDDDPRNFFISARSGGGYLTFHNNESGSIVERMRIASDGNVGIGTDAPTHKLTVDGAAEIKGLYIPGVYNVGPTNAGIGMHVDSAGFNIIKAKNGNKTIGKIHFFDHGFQNGDISKSAGAINLQADAVTLGQFSNPALYARKVDGFVGIGTVTPDQKLTVKGIIHAEEYIADLLVPGPDYVFEPTHQRPSLGDLKQYVNKHKHLPKVPSSDEMMEEGVNLLEMNMTLLEKVEELTLYLIELKEEIDALKKGE